MSSSGVDNNLKCHRVCVRKGNICSTRPQQNCIWLDYIYNIKLITSCWLPQTTFCHSFENTTWIEDCFNCYKMPCKNCDKGKLRLSWSDEQPIQCWSLQIVNVPQTHVEPDVNAWKSAHALAKKVTRKTVARRWGRSEATCLIWIDKDENTNKKIEINLDQFLFSSIIVETFCFNFESYWRVSCWILFECFSTFC